MAFSRFSSTFGGFPGCLLAFTCFYVPFTWFPIGFRWILDDVGDLADGSEPRMSSRRRLDDARGGMGGAGGM